MTGQGKKRSRGRRDGATKAPKMRRSVRPPASFFVLTQRSSLFCPTLVFLRCIRNISRGSCHHASLKSNPGARGGCRVRPSSSFESSLALPSSRAVPTHKCDGCAFAKRKCDGEACCSLCRKKGVPCVYSKVREQEGERRATPPRVVLAAGGSRLSPTPCPAHRLAVLRVVTRCRGPAKI